MFLFHQNESSRRRCPSVPVPVFCRIGGIKRISVCPIERQGRIYWPNSPLPDKMSASLSFSKPWPKRRKPAIHLPKPCRKHPPESRVWTKSPSGGCLADVRLYKRRRRFRKDAFRSRVP